MPTSSRSRTKGSSGGSSSGHGDKKGKSSAAAESEPLEYQRLSVVVFKNIDWDSYNKRHCALYIQHYNDQSAVPWRLNMIDIEGAEQMWSVRESENRDPEQSVSFARQLVIKDFPVGAGKTGQADRSLRNDIYNAPINNSNKEWNCQLWLDGALRRLRRAGWLTEQEVNEALDRTDYVLLEAPFQPKSATGANGSVQEDAW
jgi:hypothetical protein